MVEFTIVTFPTGEEEEPPPIAAPLVPPTAETSAFTIVRHATDADVEPEPIPDPKLAADPAIVELESKNARSVED
jgi:hypothetical protein